MSGIHGAGNRDPHGLSGGFRDGRDRLGIPVDFKAELEAMKRDAQRLGEERRDTLEVRTQFGLGGGVTTSFDFAGVPLYAMTHQLCQRPSEAELEEEDRYCTKWAMKQRNMYGHNRAAGNPLAVKQTFSLGEGYKVQNSTANAGISPAPP